MKIFFKYLRFLFPLKTLFCMNCIINSQKSLNWENISLGAILHKALFPKKKQQQQQLASDLNFQSQCNYNQPFNAWYTLKGNIGNFQVLLCMLYVWPFSAYQTFFCLKKRSRPKTYSTASLPFSRWNTSGTQNLLSKREGSFARAFLQN